VSLLRCKALSRSARRIKTHVTTLVTPQGNSGNWKNLHKLAIRPDTSD